MFDRGVLHVAMDSRKTKSNGAQMDNTFRMSVPITISDKSSEEDFVEYILDIIKNADIVSGYTMDAVCSQNTQDNIALFYQQCESRLFPCKEVCSYEISTARLYNSVRVILTAINPDYPDQDYME